MIAIQKEQFKLSSGREIYANQYVLGISPHDCGLFGGYDDRLFYCANSRMIDTEPLTTEEKAEIADYMIALWGQWKKMPLRYEFQ